MATIDMRMVGNDLFPTGELHRVRVSRGLLLATRGTFKRSCFGQLIRKKVDQNLIEDTARNLFNQGVFIGRSEPPSFAIRNKTINIHLRIQAVCTDKGIVEVELIFPPLMGGEWQSRMVYHHVLVNIYSEMIASDKKDKDVVRVEGLGIMTVGVNLLGDSFPVLYSCSSVAEGRYVFGAEMGMQGRFCVTKKEAEEIGLEIETAVDNLSRRGILDVSQQGILE